MKIVIAPMSALAGAGLLGLTLVAAGATQGHGPARVRIVHPVDVVGIPDPRDIIVIDEGTPYVVPVGKLFVVTAFGRTRFGNTASRLLLVDGVVVLEVDIRGNIFSTGTASMSMSPVPPHLVVSGGSTLSINPVSGGGRAWGYLIDA